MCGVKYELIVRMKQDMRKDNEKKGCDRITSNSKYWSKFNAIRQKAHFSMRKNSKLT